MRPGTIVVSVGAVVAVLFVLAVAVGAVRGVDSRDPEFGLRHWWITGRKSSRDE